MAGAATPGYQMVNPGDVLPSAYLIKNSEVVNEGDLVAINSSGQIVVATNVNAGIIKPRGVAFFYNNNSTGGAQTGDGSTVKCGIARQALIKNMTSTLCPSLAAGLPVYLAVVPTGTVSNYTCALPAAGAAVVEVGVVDQDGTTLIIEVPNVTMLQRQSAGNSDVNLA